MRILSSQSHITGARKHSMKFMDHLKSDEKYLFTEYTVNFWNLLPEESEKADSSSKASNKNRRNFCAASIIYMWTLRRQDRDKPCLILGDVGKEEEEWLQNVQVHMLSSKIEPSLMDKHLENCPEAVDRLPAFSRVLEMFHR